MNSVPADTNSPRPLQEPIFLDQGRLILELHSRLRPLGGTAMFSTQTSQAISIPRFGDLDAPAVVPPLFIHVGSRSWHAWGTVQYARGVSREKVSLGKYHPPYICERRDWVFWVLIPLGWQTLMQNNSGPGSVTGCRHEGAVGVDEGRVAPADGSIPAGCSESFGACGHHQSAI